MAVLSIPKKAVLPQELVLKMFDLAISKAKELGIKQNIAIVDDGGNLSGFIKMDGANLLPAQIAQTKAYAALGFGMPTADWYEAIKDNPAVLQGLLQVNKMTILGGGLPIFLEGQLVGGIGVSGGSPEQDVECAQAALEAIKDV